MPSLYKENKAKKNVNIQITLYSDKIKSILHITYSTRENNHERSNSCDRDLKHLKLSCRTSTRTLAF